VPLAILVSIWKEGSASPMFASALVEQQRLASHAPATMRTSVEVAPQAITRLETSAKSTNVGALREQDQLELHALNMTCMSALPAT
jgi:hypothetical protein